MTDATNTNAAVVAAGLTVGEIEALKYVKQSNVNYMGDAWESLYTKGLIEWRLKEGVDVVTNLGESVLEALEAAPAEARPAVISASQWDTVAEAVKEGCAVVTYTLNDVVTNVTSAPASKLNLQRNITHRLHFTKAGDYFDTTGYAQLTVTWLPAAPTPPAQAVGEGWQPNPRFDRYEENKRLATALGDSFPSYTEWLENCIDYRERKLEKLEVELAASQERERVAREALEPLRTTWIEWLHSTMTGIGGKPFDFHQWFWLSKEAEKAEAHYRGAYEAIENDVVKNDIHS